MSKLALSLICLLLLVVVATPLALAWSRVTIESDVEGIKTFWGITDVEKGKKIKVNVKVTNTGSIPIKGYLISCFFRKPDGTTTDLLWFDLSDKILEPGKSHYYALLTGVVADQVGTWKVTVGFHKVDKSIIDTDSKTFEVKEPENVKGEITILTIVGYTSFAAVIGGGLLLIRRIFGG